jgi:uncharacterized protein
MRHKFLCAISVVTFVFIAGASSLAEPFQEIQDAWNSKDYPKALQLLRPLAEKGNDRAEFLIGYAYQGGMGVSKDDAEAMKWYRRAAEKGDDIAQFNVGVMYQNGNGVPRDVVIAYMWLHLAAMRGHQGAAMDRDRLAGSMSHAQIEEAQQLARNWRPKSAKVRR